MEIKYGLIYWKLVDKLQKVQTDNKRPLRQHTKLSLGRNGLNFHLHKFNNLIFCIPLVQLSVKRTDCLK
jgi:hypothetical protein